MLVNKEHIKLRNMTAIYFINNDEILLLYRIGSRVVDPSWCGIGGHFESNELNTPYVCAIRELYEETGISEDDIDTINLRYIVIRNKNHEIRQNYYYFATLKDPKQDISKCNEGNLKWFKQSEILSLTMPLSAKGTLKHYLNKGLNTQKIYTGTTTKHGVIISECEDF